MQSIALKKPFYIFAKNAFVKILLYLDTFFRNQFCEKFGSNDGFLFFGECFSENLALSKACNKTTDLVMGGKDPSQPYVGGTHGGTEA